MTLTVKRIVGNIGEDHAVEHLIKSGFQILERNYLRKWGEIDIVALKKDVLYFVEVKTVSSNYYINHDNWYRPEDKVHKRKTARLKRAVQSYLFEKDISMEREWEFSVITVVLKRKTKELYKLEHLENLII